MEEINLDKKTRDDISKMARGAMNTLYIIFLFILIAIIFLLKKGFISTFQNAVLHFTDSILLNIVIITISAAIILFLKSIIYDVLFKSIMEQFNINKAALSNDTKFYKLSVKNYNLLEDEEKNMYIKVYLDNIPYKVPIFGLTKNINEGDNIFILSYNNKMISYTEEFLQRRENIYDK